MNGVLDGLRVIDLGRYVAGPYCATLLGYLGAEVIRVERPAGGEDRYIAPLDELDAGGVMMQTGCNKKSLTLNLRHPDSREILDRLVTSADIVVANLPPAALAKLGLDYERISGLNPRIILTTLTAFGQSGPWAERGGFDGVGQAMSGAMYMTGTPGRPVKAAAPYVDYSTATLATVGTLAAVIERETSGRGQHVEGSLLGTALAVFNSHLAEEGALGLGREPTGNRVQTSAPSDVFATRDGHVLIHVIGNAIFGRLAELIGADDWRDDPGLTTDQARGDRRDELCDRVAAWCETRTTDDAIEAFAEAGIPAGPVLSLDGALQHPQAAALGILQSVKYPGRETAVPVVDLPVTLSRTPGGIRTPPPVTSADTDAVLEDLGYTTEAISALHADGVV
ncbi:MAG: CoA transferase [Woeseiaceae bacterium]|nr:CoA transferase [Woeseiaceae bacterium]